MNTLSFTPIKKILFIAQAPGFFYRQSLIENAQQFFLGPDVSDVEHHNEYSLNARLTPEMKDGEVLSRFLDNQGFTPEIVFIKADATRRNHISNLRALKGKKILLMGDTHHMVHPLKTMLSYAIQEPWDLVSSEHDRHHLPLFAEAGVRNLIWLPCFTMNPHKHTPCVATDERTVFVGSLSAHHIQRQRIIGQLQKRGVSVHVTTAPQNEAARLYNQHAISLNISLNGDLNFRIMEVLASGGCLLTDRLGPDSGLNELFTEGVHYLAYSSADEAAYWIDFVRRNPAQRQCIAEAGFQRFWSYCSPDLQCQALLSALTGQSIPERFKAPQ